MDARERIKEIENRLCEINSERWKLERERDELAKQYKGWYIVNRFVGDGDYWDEYLHPLGFVTEETAENWVNEHSDYDAEYWVGVFPPYVEVSKEEYDKYCDWQKLQRVLQIMPTRKQYLDMRDLICTVIDDLKSTLLNDNKRYSFIHIDTCEVTDEQNDPKAFLYGA